MKVLRSMAAVYVVPPNTDEVKAVEEGFQLVAGFPGVVGAVDGTLIAIPRPHDFEGWYCRKGFSAINVQAIVDHLGTFRFISIRSGSYNDQSLWNGSGARKRNISASLLEFAPPGKHLLADAGYKIWAHMLTPFSESEAVTIRRKRVYNRLHSRTQIAVECASGRLRNRFRILLGKLEQKTPERICRLIYSCVVLHKMLLATHYEPNPTSSAMTEG
ncbi:DDE superfamily endonuclease [Phytophthora infestans]|uniref:DDE superfamily endonuclease n=1 Tax=Phytophthora infestans TaxID=4787 RepID=A0A8S9TNS5_PHYIN|nr:DDE superfamily endonuclease [Phytophthora infestans]